MDNILVIENENKEINIANETTVGKFSSIFPEKYNPYEAEIDKLSPEISVLRLIVKKDYLKPNAVQTHELHAEYIYLNNPQQLLTTTNFACGSFARELKNPRVNNTLTETKFFDTFYEEKTKKYSLIFKQKINKEDTNIMLKYTFYEAEEMSSTYFRTKSQYLDKTSKDYPIDDDTLINILREKGLI